MAGEPGDKFPTYAELAQTQAWAGGAPVPIMAQDLEMNPGDSGSRYTEQAVLGVGGMGKVVLAHDARIGREVAVKQLRSERELTPEERSRFLREAQVQGQLEHPSIVPVYDIDYRPDGTTFFTMRRVLGRTLHDILDDLRRGIPESVARYTQRELLQAFATVCLAVDYAHSRGVIHRDLKPANIMLGDFGEVYVLDWGVARLVDPHDAGEPRPRLSMPGMGLGTPVYMAPEQFDDPNVDAAADVFALGAVLFEILTLQRLRTSGRGVAAVDARPRARAPERGVAPELEIICERATQLDPADRYPSARALQEAIARFLEGDRELEQRRELAAGHAERARAARQRLEEPDADHRQETGIAIRELARALALEPMNQEHIAMFAEIMSAQPRVTPPELSARIAAQTQSVLRAGAQYSGLAAIAWFLFLPLLLAMGLRRLDYVFVIAIPLVISVVLSLAAVRQRPIRQWILCAALFAILVASAAVSRILGPLIVMPTLFTAWIIVMQTSPEPFMRRFSVVAGVLLMLAPLGLELAGVIPSSYVFEDGKISVLPQMTGLPERATLAFAALANVGAGVAPAIFVARLRGDLTDAQKRELLRAWQLRRLPEELMRAHPR
ncbi:MAG TPA: serine/threonine-protein kinase [Kofleriaceae bacterium]|nr:serine/threonine-protein kinase [Kofleriaceae bacterium]